MDFRGVRPLFSTKKIYLQFQKKHEFIVGKHPFFTGSFLIDDQQHVVVER